MSSVSAKAADQRVESIRNEYLKRSDDQKRKHAGELKRLSQAYAKNLEELRGEHSKTLNSYREKSRASLSAKDQKYQEKIHDIQVAHRRNLEQQVGTLKSTHKNQIDGLQTEMEKEKKINQLQQERLKKTFSQEIEKKDKLYQEFAEENAKKSREMLEARVTDLSNRHRQVQRDIASDRDAKLARKAEEAQLQKQIASKELGDTKRLLENRLNFERRTSTANLMAEREANKNINEMQRKAFTIGLEDVRDKFQSANAKNVKSFQDARRSFEDTVNERIDTRLGALEGKIIHLKKVHDGEKLKLRQELDNEKKVLAKDFRDRIKGFDKSRIELVNQFNDITQDKINDVVFNKDMHFKQQMRRVRDDQTTRDMINRQALADLRTHHEARQIHVETQASHRVEAMKEDVNRKLKLMEGDYKSRLETQKDEFQKNMQEIRVQGQEERAGIVRKFHIQARQREKFYDDKIKALKLNHKNEVEGIRRENERSMKRLGDAKDRKFFDQRRAYEKQLDSMKLYYEEQATDARTSHEDEINRLKSNHEQQIRKIIIAHQGKQHDEQDAALNRS